MIRNRLMHIVTGVAVLAISACDRTVESGGETVNDGTSQLGSADQVACLDPATGELIQPGPGVECSVPEQAKSLEEPVVRDLDGGGKSVELKGKFDQNQVAPTSPNRVVVIDRKTGKLLNQRPTDPMAALRYDRSVARVNAIMKRQSKRHPAEILYPEVMANGGIKVDLQGRFQIPLVASISEDGQIHLEHQQH